MKLNWFSPLPPAPTDIAHYTKRVLPALSRVAQVTLWTDRTNWDSALEAYATVRAYSADRMPWVDVNRADLSVYHIGNNPLFHGPIWLASRKHPGLVVLHDTHLHHFFDGLYRAQWHDLENYLKVMERYYGVEGRRAGRESYQNDARGINEMAQRYPLTQHATEHALGVLVHTREAFAQLAPELHAPLAYAPLPFDATTQIQLNQTRGAEFGSSQGQPCRLIIFGYLGRNRRVEIILKALAEFPARNRLRLDLYGEMADAREIQKQIRKLGLESLVTVHGFVREAELDAALAAADLALNLRYPTMGEASGSQLRIWAHALPSIVTQIGWYGSLPEDVVAFVRPEHEIADLHKHFEGILENRERYAALGRAGRRRLEEQHTPELYVQTLLALARRAMDFRARAAAYKLAEQAASRFNDVTGPALREEWLARVAQEIYRLQ